MKTRKISFMRMLLMIGCIPLAMAIVALAIYSGISMKNELEENTYEKLKACATSVQQYFEYDIRNDILDPLDIESVNFIDSLQGQGIELTLFEKDVRVTTSIRNDSNETGRNIGTTANADIWSSVSAGSDHSSDGVIINGENYYVYYTPVYGLDGEVWGMAFAGEKESTINSAIIKIVSGVILISSAIFIFCSILILFISRKAVRPLTCIANATKILSNGVLTEDISAVSSLKETNILLDAAQTLQRTLKQSIGSVKSGAESLSEAVMDVDKKAEDNMESMTQISEAINEVAETSTSIAQSAQTLAHKADELGLSIEELTSTVQSLSGSSNVIKHANADACEYMNTVLVSSEKSTSAVKSIVDEIAETNKAIQNIEEATSMIEDIASQTKLLSLNASIEAARAGDAGNGFAVVAQNIKGLAEQSSSNVEKIRSIITQIINLSQNTVNDAEAVRRTIEEEKKYIADTQERFSVLSKNVDSSINSIASISEMTVSLNSIKNEVTNATADLGAISEELSASSEEVSASATQVTEALATTRADTEEMSAINKNLIEAVSFFSME